MADISPGIRDWSTYPEELQERYVKAARARRPRPRNFVEVREFVMDRALDMYPEDAAYTDRISEDVWHALWLRR